MEDRGVYNLTQTQIVETDMKAIALSAAAEIGYTLTQEQATELAYHLAESQAAVRGVVAKYCGGLVYDLENEHPTHTWARWASDLENDQTPPCQSYVDYVAGQHYLADRAFPYDSQGAERDAHSEQALVAVRWAIALVDEARLLRDQKYDALPDPTEADSRS